MSKMGNLVMEIEEMIQSGVPALAIAAVLNIPSEFVWNVKDALNDAENECYEYDDEGLIDEY